MVSTRLMLTKEHTMTTQHTPTPWRAAINMDGRHQAFSIMADSPAFHKDEWPYQPLIAQTLHGKGCATLEVARANAAHIVKCVNLHDELIEALDMIFSTGVATSINPDGVWATKARAVLAKVKGCA